jgi:hypothetical protein
LNRRSDDTVKSSRTTTLSRSNRALALRLISPEVTMHPAMVPTREDRKTSRTSARPSATSSYSGLSMPFSACSISSIAW